MINLNSNLIVKTLSLPCSVLLYAISLLTPAVQYNEQLIYGWEMLILGWIGVFASVAGGIAQLNFPFLLPVFPWLANPLLFFVWIFIYNYRYRNALYAAIVTVLLVVLYLNEPVALPDGNGFELAYVDLRLGYRLWFLSGVVPTVFLISAYLANKKKYH